MLPFKMKPCLFTTDNPCKCTPAFPLWLEPAITPPLLKYNCWPNQQKEVVLVVTMTKAFCKRERESEVQMSATRWTGVTLKLTIGYVDSPHAVPARLSFQESCTEKLTTLIIWAKILNAQIKPHWIGSVLLSILAKPFAAFKRGIMALCTKHKYM